MVTLYLTLCLILTIIIGASLETKGWERTASIFPGLAAGFLVTAVVSLSIFVTEQPFTILACVILTISALGTGLQAAINGDVAPSRILMGVSMSGMISCGIVGFDSLISSGLL